MTINPGDIFEIADDGESFGMKRVMRVRVMSVFDELVLSIGTETIDTPNYLGLCGFVTGNDPNAILTKLWTRKSFEEQARRAADIRWEVEQLGKYNIFIRTDYVSTTRPGAL